MVNQIITTLQNSANQPIALLLAFVLGAVSAASSTCCTLPTLGILLGYSGTQSEIDRRSALRFCGLFTLGIIVSLIIIGGIAGLFGFVAQQSLGLYWKIFAGFIAIILGFITLNLIPLKLPTAIQKVLNHRSSGIQTTAFGILMGGGVAVSSLPCNPGIFIVLGAAVLQGAVLWAMMLLFVYSIGFSLPLGGILLGVSMGKTIPFARKLGGGIRKVSGVILIVAGFYLLLSI